MINGGVGFVLLAYKLTCVLSNFKHKRPFPACFLPQQQQATRTTQGSKPHLWSVRFCFSLFLFFMCRWCMYVHACMRMMWLASSPCGVRQFGHQLHDGVVLPNGAVAAVDEMKQHAQGGPSRDVATKQSRPLVPLLLGNLFCFTNRKTTTASEQQQ